MRHVYIVSTCSNCGTFEPEHGVGVGGHNDRELVSDQRDALRRKQIVACLQAGSAWCSWLFDNLVGVPRATVLSERVSTSAINCNRLLGRQALASHSKFFHRFKQFDVGCNTDVLAMAHSKPEQYFTMHCIHPKAPTTSSCQVALAAYPSQIQMIPNDRE
jgi:hypothetical protein